MGLAAGLLLLVLLFGYTFWPEKTTVAVQTNTRLDFLRERRDMVYSNLRDLNFEHKAGKYPPEDYAVQRDMLEAEAAAIVSEIDVLEHV